MLWTDGPPRGGFVRRRMRRLRTRHLARDRDRDAIASMLMRYRDENGQGWADLIDVLTMYPDARRTVVRVLGEIEAAPGP